MRHTRKFAARHGLLPTLVLVAVIVAACDSTVEGADCAAGEDIIASALVDGRLLAVGLGASHDNGLSLTSSLGRTVSMTAYCPGGGNAEGLQFWLDGFHGVGAYPVTGDGSDSSSTTVYWIGSGEHVKSYWGDTVTGDTVWVTAFDTLTRAIEGHFTMSGSHGDVHVKVTDGHYRGIVHDYLPSP